MFVWEGEEDTQQHTLHLVFSLGMQLTNAPLSPLPIAERGFSTPFFVSSLRFPSQRT